jgi:tetratricopeptide (TPR) repeat protein
MVRGVVKDASGKPVEGAKVNIDADANNRHFDTKSDKKGEFVQIGLPPGAYKVTAEKDKQVSPPSNITVRIAASAPVTLVIGAGGASPEVAAKNAELKKTFEEGVAASRAGNHDAAIASFTKAAELNAGCYDCYYNIAFSESQKKDFDKAEAAYKKAIEIKPDYAEGMRTLAYYTNRDTNWMFRDVVARIAAAAGASLPQLPCDPLPPGSPLPDGWHWTEEGKTERDEIRPLLPDMPLPDHPNLTAPQAASLVKFWAHLPSGKIIHEPSRGLWASGSFDKHIGRITTGELNRFLGELREARQPPSRGNKKLNLLYGAQVATRPPRFRFTVNDTSLVTRDYAYWVENELRERFELEGVPVAIDFRRRS